MFCCTKSMDCLLYFLIRISSKTVINYCFIIKMWSQSSEAAVERRPTVVHRLCTHAVKGPSHTAHVDQPATDHVTEIHSTGDTHNSSAGTNYGLYFSRAKDSTTATNTEEHSYLHSETSSAPFTTFTFCSVSVPTPWLFKLISPLISLHLMTHNHRYHSDVNTQTFMKGNLRCSAVSLHFSPSSPAWMEPYRDKSDWLDVIWKERRTSLNGVGGAASGWLISNIKLAKKNFPQHQCID